MIKKENFVSNQLKEVRNYTGLTQQEFAKNLEVSLSTIANIENGSREISKSLMKLLVEKYKVSALWLLTGEGPMMQEEKKEGQLGSQKIPLLGQTVSCGPGQDWQDSDAVEEYIEPLSLLPLRATSKVFAFRSRGLSMVGAGINDGDIIIFDAASKDLCDDLYVFSLEGSVYCKLIKFDRIAQRIQIYSVQSPDLAEAELIRTIDFSRETDTSFQIFGKVIVWIHENTLVCR